MSIQEQTERAVSKIPKGEGFTVTLIMADLSSWNNDRGS